MASLNRGRKSLTFLTMRQRRQIDFYFNSAWGNYIFPSIPSQTILLSTSAFFDSQNEIRFKHIALSVRKRQLSRFRCCTVKLCLRIPTSFLSLKNLEAVSRVFWQCNRYFMCDSEMSQHHYFTMVCYKYLLTFGLELLLIFTQSVAQRLESIRWTAVGRNS